MVEEFCCRDEGEHSQGHLEESILSMASRMELVGVQPALPLGCGRQGMEGRQRGREEEDRKRRGRQRGREGMERAQGNQENQESAAKMAGRIKLTSGRERFRVAGGVRRAGWGHRY